MRAFRKLIGLLLLPCILSLLGGIALAEEKSGTVTYHPIEGVRPEINRLGRRLMQAQRDEVWTGGNEQTGCYMDTDAERFHPTGKLKKILQQVRADPSFRPAITALKKLSGTKLNAILEAWNKPIDPTWAENGHIGNDGTTEAGKQIETEIAAGLTDMVRTAVHQK